MVEIRTRVVIYGSSLHMAGIAASLRGDPRLEVLCVDPHAPTAAESLSELHAAVIAFDLSDPSTGLDVSLLRQKPGVLLIGIDPASDEMLILWGRSQQALSVSDLVQAIQRTVHPGRMGRQSPQH